MLKRLFFVLWIIVVGIIAATLATGQGGWSEILFFSTPAIILAAITFIVQPFHEP
jgi:hypothetical protein